MGPFFGGLLRRGLLGGALAVGGVLRLAGWGGFCGILAHDLLRVLVLAQPLERGMAQDAVAGPFGEGHLADQLRLQPVAAAGLGAARRVLEGRLRDLQLVHAGAQLAQRARR